MKNVLLLAVFFVSMLLLIVLWQQHYLKRMLAHLQLSLAFDSDRPKLQFPTERAYLRHFNRRWREMYGDSEKGVA